MHQAAHVCPCMINRMSLVSTKRPIGRCIRARNSRRCPAFRVMAQAADPSEDEKRRAVEEAMQNPEVRGDLDAATMPLDAQGLSASCCNRRAPHWSASL